MIQCFYHIHNCFSLLCLPKNATPICKTSIFWQSHGYDIVSPVVRSSLCNNIIYPSPANFRSQSRRKITNRTACGKIAPAANLFFFIFYKYYISILKRFHFLKGVKFSTRKNRTTARHANKTMISYWKKYSVVVYWCQEKSLAAGLNWQMNRL